MFIRAYVGRLTRAELFIVMTSGMASIAGTVFALYVTVLGPSIPDVAVHLLVASVLSAPAVTWSSGVEIEGKVLPFVDRRGAGRRGGCAGRPAAKAAGCHGTVRLRGYRKTRSGYDGATDDGGARWRLALHGRA